MLNAPNYRDTFLSPQASLEAALEVLDRTALRVCMVVDENELLQGILTDGDIRRALLHGGGRETRVDEIMNRDFFSMHFDANPNEVRQAMRARTIIQVPLLDSEGKVKGLASRFLNPRVVDVKVKVVLMAGGLGSRLGALTKNTPKPMLELGGKPILEHIIVSLRDQGFQDFAISVNYLAHKIENYFGNGADLGVNIDYIRETERRGTAGALSSLELGEQDELLLVMNGDVISDLPLNDFIQFHLESDADASMCVREQSAKVEFGVVEFDNDSNTLLSLREKPSVTHFINAGIYCLSRDVLALIPKNTMFDMPALFQGVQDGNGKARVYPCEGFWIDIGRPEDYERALTMFKETAHMRRDRLDYGSVIVSAGDLDRSDI
jgi:dTDP-glucose pyrophosphorylase